MKTGAPLGEVQRLKTCVCVCAKANCKLKNTAFVSSFALNSNPQFNLNYLFPATQVARWIKNPLQYRKHRKTSGRSLGWKDPLEEGMSNPYSILTWKIPCTEEPDRLQSIQMQRVRHNWSNWAHTHLLHIFCTLSQLIREAAVKHDLGFGHLKTPLGCISEMPQDMVAVVFELCGDLWMVTGSSAGMSTGTSTCVFLYMEITRQSDFLHVLSTEQGNQVEVTQPNSGCHVASCLPRFVGFSKVIWPGKQDSRERK